MIHDNPEWVSDVERNHLELIGDAYESDLSWNVLQSLTDVGNRMAGQAGEKEGIQVLKTWFDQFGFRDVSVQSFDVPGWWRGDSSLTVTGDLKKTYSAQHELIALPGSPAGTRSGGVVDVGAGLPEDFESTDVTGDIVLVSSETPKDYGRWVHRTEKYSLAVEHGAVGFLFQNEISGCLPLTGSIGWDGLAEIPAVGISWEVGAELRRYCESGATNATLDLTTHRESSTSQNIEAVVGPDTDREVLLTAHVDAHDISSGATDNGVGCAVVTEAARLLNRYVSLDTRVRVVVFGSEEIGLLGSEHWIKTHDPRNVKSIINVDGNGKWDNLIVYTHGSKILTDIFEDTGERLHPSMNVDEDDLEHSDHWSFVQRGVPGVMIRSESNTGRGWGHTHADTLDKLDQMPLRQLVIALSDSVVQIASSGCEPQFQSTRTDD